MTHDYGGNLKKARQNAGLSQFKLSELSGIEQSHISAIENRKNLPSVDVYVKLAEALGINVSTLIYMDYMEA